MTIKFIPYAIVCAFAFALFSMHTGCTKSSGSHTDTTYITKTDTFTNTVTDTVAPMPPNMTTGLVLYLNFNGSMADSSGLGNTITAVGGASLGYDMHGNAQSALSSNGSGQMLEVTNNGSYAVDTAFSLSFDFMIRSYATSANNLECFASLVDYSNGNGPTFAAGFVIPGISQNNFTLGINSELSSCESNLDSDPRNAIDTSNFTPQLGDWYNAICIFSHGTASTYINGQLISKKSGLADSVLFCPNATLIIGGFYNGSESVNGEMDEVRFYNRTLNAAQIAWLARNFQVNATKQKPAAGHSAVIGIK